MRRIPNRCYLCGDPTVNEWYCVAHLWAGGQGVSEKKVNGIKRMTRDHAFWVERFTPEQIVELAGYLDSNGTGVAV